MYTFILILSGCASDNPSQMSYDAEQNAYCLDALDRLEKYNFDDGTNDAIKAIKAGDKRYIAVYGYTVIIPGIADMEEQFNIRVQKNYRLLEGTSDMLCSERHGELNVIAYDYATKYNTIIEKFSATSRP